MQLLLVHSITISLGCFLFLSSYLLKLCFVGAMVLDSWAWKFVADVWIIMKLMKSG